MLLQQQRRTTAGELARRLEVSERTIYRDIEALQASGVPIYTEPGRNGGIRLLERYRTDLSGLSLGEAEVVPLLGLGDALAGMGLGSLAQTEAKVLAALPEAQRERAEHMRRKIHVDLSAWWHGTELVPRMGVLVEAAFTGHRLRVRYRRGNDDRVVTRTLDPLGLVLKAGVWYLVASAGGEDPRTYRGARIMEAEVLAQPSAPRPDFDLASFWTGRRDDFQTRASSYEVTVRARPEAARSLRNDYEVEPPDAEWTTLGLTFGTKDHALRRLLSFGPDVEVLEPDGLREAITQAVDRTAFLYRS
jgi:predicted DNA-binding transcriptional regulator YafY